ncbi:MAG: response regulator transcription factor [Rhodocyclaceae bacterium]|nr:response regulator transcription factor [Rhodocyclaceae bacterium]
MNIKVLLADDHPVLAEGLRYIIGAQPDMTVVGTAGDGQESVRQTLALRPQVVLMDISMPTLNGVEAAETICLRAPETQVVMLSMHGGIEYVLRALRAGARGYVVKKSASQEVVAAIRAAHMGRRYLSTDIDERAVDELLRGGGAQNRLELLSMRERQVLRMIVDSVATADIAELLSLSPRTVETYRWRVMNKLGIYDIPGLVKFAIREGLTTTA